MPAFRVPFSEIPKKAVLPKGDYPGLIRVVKKEPNSAGDGDNLVWDIDILDPQYEGTSVRMWTGLKLAGLWKLEGILVNLGLAEEGKDLDLEIDEETNEVPVLAERPCVARLSVGRSLDGKREQNNVEDLFGPEGPPTPQSNSTEGARRRPRSR